MFDGICIRASDVCGYLFNTKIMFKSVRGDWYGLIKQFLKPWNVLHLSTKWNSSSISSPQKIHSLLSLVIPVNLPLSMAKLWPLNLRDELIVSA
jgi:hypothetical protein